MITINQKRTELRTEYKQLNKIVLHVTDLLRDQEFASEEWGRTYEILEKVSKQQIDALDRLNSRR